MSVLKRGAALSLFFVSLALSRPVGAQSIAVDSLPLFDTLRQRPVPVALYRPTRLPKRPKIAIISHGYGGRNTAYSFIARELVSDGYMVAGVQHEVPGDEPIPLTGEPRVVRRPNWERGVQNIRFALNSLKHRFPSLDTKSLLLVGHSNGGDQSALYAELYPTEVAALISLDNRRMPLPRARRPRVLSIRSSDQRADDGVLPTADEQRTYGITIAPQAVIHNDMWDGATDAQKTAMLDAIRRFLRRR